MHAVVPSLVQLLIFLEGSAHPNVWVQIAFHRVIKSHKGHKDHPKCARPVQVQEQVANYLECKLNRGSISDLFLHRPGTLGGGSLWSWRDFKDSPNSYMLSVGPLITQTVPLG